MRLNGLARRVLLLACVAFYSVTYVSAQASTPPPDQCTTPGHFTISPRDARIGPGGTVIFTASADSKCTVPALQWAIVSDPGSTLDQAKIDPKSTPAGSGSVALTLNLQRDAIEKAIHDDPGKAYIHVTATATSDNPQTAIATAMVTTKAPGNIIIPIIGFEQAGGSSAQSAQKFFMNLFVNRPLPFGHDLILDDGVNLGTPYRWFGDVRIASYPQQINSSVGEFATGFAGQVASLKVNQVAQSGEFNMGLDLRLRSPRWSLYGIGDSNVKEYSMLSFVAGFGAISPLNPVENLQIFYTPPVGSPQRDPFLALYPGSANSTYTGFIPPDRGRFYWEYGAGFRFTTLYFDRSNVQGYVTPAMLTYTLGQNQIVTGGASTGVVQRIEGFLPLPLGERFARNVTTLYLFGRVDMRLARPKQSTPFVLQPAPDTVHGYDPDVNIVRAGSTRDLYTIGVGVDAIKLIKAISLQNKTTKAASTSAAAPPPH
ncbi:MAG TPA: hypothetical protein VE377_02100 [Candidatus Dormibacteraeota bacterium]|nr:hypothetical protein [Candidatus Dormibacteraeota bacterium]